MFAEVEYPQELTKLIGTPEQWRKFCALPHALKEHFSLEYEKDLDAGYHLRSKQGGREDKEYFHFCDGISEKFLRKEISDVIKKEKKVENFLHYAQKVHDASHAFPLDIAREIAEKVPQLDTLIQNNKIQSTLRFLHYTNNVKDEIIAAQHFDRGLFSLHLYESHPGLQFLNFDMEWSDAPVTTGKTVVFNAYRGERLANSELQKTWHRVIQQGGTSHRISMVLFVWTREISDYNKGSRSQDLEPSYITP